MYQLLTRILPTLTLQQLAEASERPVRFAGGFRPRPARTLPAVHVQRHDGQHQQQLLRDELADAYAAAFGPHRLEVAGYATRLGLGGDERNLRRRGEGQLHRLHAALTLERHGAL